MSPGVGPGAWRGPAMLAVIAATLATVGLAAPAAHGGGLGLRPCHRTGGFLCGKLTVPVDPARPGGRKLRLAVAAQPARGRSKVLVALAGGPGQGAVPYAEQFAASLRPELSGHRLVVIDQRGTGASAALLCPELQKAGELEPLTAADTARCAAEVGPTAPHYGTVESAADLDLLRRALGARELALMGISYGTWVAQVYARLYPAQTERLILDSVVGPGDPEAFSLDSWSAVPRVLAELCGAGRCRGVTDDMLGDLGAVAASLRQAPIAGTVFGASGRPAKATLTEEGELFTYLVTGDTNPMLQALMPAALVSTRAGDPAPLLRLRALAAGPPAPAADLSVALYVMTSCLDTDLPYGLGDPASVREEKYAQAVGAIPAEAHVPFSRSAVVEASYADFCRGFPVTAGVKPATGTLPRVPALILGGRLDLRTPVTNAAAVARAIPGASLVTVPGTGHDTIDSDFTGCVGLALRRFAAGKAVGDPCRRSTNQVPVRPVAPLAVGTSASPEAVARAAVASAADARSIAIARYWAGLPVAAGGLRGGSVRGGDPLAGALRLSRYRYAADLAVSGSVSSSFEGVSGRVTFTGVATGELRIATDGSARGKVNGTAVRLGRPTASARVAARPVPSVQR